MVFSFSFSFRGLASVAFRGGSGNELVFRVSSLCRYCLIQWSCKTGERGAGAPCVLVSPKLVDYEEQ